MTGSESTIRARADRYESLGWDGAANHLRDELEEPEVPEALEDAGEKTLEESTKEVFRNAVMVSTGCDESDLVEALQSDTGVESDEFAEKCEDLGWDGAAAYARRDS